MSERQKSYRANYRQRVAGWYNGFLHIAIIYTIGLTALYVYISNIHDVRPLEWLTIPVVFLFCNFFEWWLHLYVMHLAFAMLYDHSGDASLAIRLAKPFMEEVTANFGNEWEMTTADMSSAIAQIETIGAG